MKFPLKKYFVKKESWKRFGVKAGVTLLVLWAAGAAFASRYRIGIDPQQEKCLPGYTFFLIDLTLFDWEAQTPAESEHPFTFTSFEYLDKITPQ